MHRSRNCEQRLTNERKSARTLTCVVVPSLLELYLLSCVSPVPGQCQALRYTGDAIDQLQLGQASSSHCSSVRQSVSQSVAASIRGLRDVSYPSFDVHTDDSYTGRGRVERRRRDLRLRRCDSVAVELKFNTDSSAAKMPN